MSHRDPTGCVRVSNYVIPRPLISKDDQHRAARQQQLPTRPDYTLYTLQVGEAPVALSISVSLEAFPTLLSRLSICQNTC